MTEENGSLNISIGDEELESQTSIYRGAISFTFDGVDYTVDYDKTVFYDKRTQNEFDLLIDKPKDINEEDWLHILAHITAELYK